MNWNHILYKKSITIYIYIVTIILITVGYYIIVSHTPLYEDDYYYSYINAPVDIKAKFPFFLPLYTDYFAGVARFIPHNLVALFQLITGKYIFDILVTIGFIGLCFCIAKVIVSDFSRQLIITLFVASTIWLVIPGFFQAMLWMSGACNYLFPAILILLFYLSLRSARQYDITWWNAILWFGFGFITGWTNEGFVVGFAAGLICYVFYNKNEIDKRRRIMLFGFLLGAICLCFSPFNLYRFFNGQSDFNLKSIISSIIALGNVRITFWLIIMYFLLFFIGDKTKLIDFTRRYIVFIIAVFVSLLFIVLTKHTSDYSRFPMELFSLIVISALLVNFLPRVMPFIAWMLSLFTIVTMSLLIPKCYANYSSYEDMKKQILGGNKLVVVENIRTNNFDTRYIKPVLSIYHSWVMNNNEVVKYYGGDTASVIISCDMFKKMKDSGIGKCFYDRNWGFNIMEIPFSSNVSNVKLKLNTYDFGKFPKFIRPVLSKMERFNLNEIDTYKYKIIVINNRKWILVFDNEMVKDRLNKIEIILDHKNRERNSLKDVKV